MNELFMYHEHRIFCNSTYTPTKSLINLECGIFLQTKILKGINKMKGNK